MSSGGHHAAADQEHAHDQRGRGQQLARVPDPSRRAHGVVAGIAAHQRHHRHPRLEPGEAEGQLREEEQRRARSSAAAELMAARRGACRQFARCSGWRSTSTTIAASRTAFRREVDGDDERRRSRWPRGTPSGRPRPGARAARGSCPPGDRKACGTNGFSTMCAVASAADRVMVMMKSVKAKPSRTRTKALPFQRGSSSSSMRMLPWPWGLCCGHLAVDGQGHEQRDQHQHQRGDRRQDAGGQEGDAGLVAEGREVVDAGQAHDLPPRVGRMRVVGGLGAEAVEEPAEEGRPRGSPAAGGAGRWRRLRERAVAGRRRLVTHVVCPVYSMGPVGARLAAEETARGRTEYRKRQRGRRRDQPGHEMQGQADGPSQEQRNADRVEEEDGASRTARTRCAPPARRRPRTGAGRRAGPTADGQRHRATPSRAKARTIPRTNVIALCRRS